MLNSKARRARHAVIPAAGDPGAHRGTAAATAEQRKEPQRGGAFVHITNFGDEIDPAVSDSGQTLHVRNEGSARQIPKSTRFLSVVDVDSRREYRSCYLSRPGSG